MRILLLAQFYPPQGLEGSGKHYDLVRKLVDAGHHVTVIAGRISYMTGRPFAAGAMDSKHGDSNPFTRGSCREIRLWTPAGYNTSLATRAIALLVLMLQALAVALAQRQVDVVFVTSPPSTLAVVGAVMRRIRRVRFVLEIRDMWAEDAISLGFVRGRHLISLVRRCERWVERSADTIVPVTPGLASILGGRGVPESAIVAIPNGVDTAVFRPGIDASAVVERFNLSGKFVVGCCGALGINNDVSTILEAAAELKTDEGIVFLLVGDGNAKRDAEHAAWRRGLTNVKFAGWVPHLAVPAHLAAVNAAICIALPHPLNRAAYANRAFEAMATGRPLLCLIDGLMRDIVERSQSGIFVTPGNGVLLAEGIRRLIVMGPDRCAAMGDRGREFVERCFSRSRSIEQLHHVVIGSEPGGESTSIGRLS